MKRLVSSLAMVILGCGSSDSPGSTDSATTDSGVIDSATTDAAGDSPTPPGERIQLLDILHTAGVADFNVAVLGADGAELVRTTTGADGIATLAGVTWSDAPTFLLFWKKSYRVELVAVTKTMLTEAAAYTNRKPGEPPVFLTFVLPTTRPTLSGNVTGLMDPAHGYFVNGPGFFFNPPPATPAYTLRPLAGQKDPWVGSELSFTAEARSVQRVHYQWVVFDGVPITADTTLDLDFAKARKLTTTHVKGTIEVTGGNDGPLGGDTKINLLASLGEAAIMTTGAHLTMVPNADSSQFAYELELADAKLDYPLRHYATITRTDGANAQRFIDGAPTEGEVIKDFDYPIAVTATTVSVKDPISFEGAAAGSVRYLAGSGPTGDSVFRLVVAADVTATSVTMPKLPKDVLAMLPTSMTAVMGTTRDFLAWRQGKYVTTSRSFSLTK